MNRLIASFFILITVGPFTYFLSANSNEAPLPRIPIESLIELIDNVDTNTVLIKGHNNKPSGSGITIVRDKDVYVFTSAHVVEDSLSIENGEVLWKSPKIYKKLIKNGVDEGATESALDIVIYDKSIDIALLKVKHPITSYYKNTRFYLDDKKLPRGTPLLLVGNYLDVPNFNEGLTGAVRASIGELGRTVNGQVMDLAFNCTIVGGMSGSGVWKEDGRCVGLVCRRANNNICLYCPIREMIKWAKENEVMWALDESVKKAK